MSLPRIRDEFHVPARLGQRVRIPISVHDDTKFLNGVIVGSDGDRLKVQGAAFTAKVPPGLLTYLRGA